MENEKRKGNRGGLLGLIPALLLAVLAAGLLLTPKSEPDRELADRTAEAAAPYLVEEASFFSDFEVVDDHVCFLCRLTVRNPSETPLPVKISGDFSADAKSGLILGQGLPALRLDGETGADFLALDAAEQEAILGDRSRLLFLLQPGDNTFWVVFSGLHGEASVKQDRLLPQIHFSLLADVTPEAVSAAMDCRIFKDPDECDAFLLDGEELFALGFGFGGYGFTSAVPFEYGFNEVPDLLFTYSWGSGMHRSHLALFDRTTKEEQELYVYYPSGGGEDLLVELDPDGYPAIVYTADVTVNGDGFTDLRFTKREKAGEVIFVLSEDEALSGPRFFPDEDFHGLSDMPETVPEFGTAEAAAPQGCGVTYGGGKTEVSGETAAELYRICRGAMNRGESTVIGGHEQEMLYLLLGFPGEDDTDPVNKPCYCVYADDRGWFSASGYASFRPEFCFPAGTYDALIDVLERDGALPVPAGERIEGNEVYALFEDKGVYAVQLYGADGELVWACGPVNHEPLVAEEEPGLWSVSVQAGTGLSTRWTLYYAPGTGTLSPRCYGVLDRQRDRLIHLDSSKQLEVRGLFGTEEGVVLRHFSEPLSNAVEPFVAATFTEDSKGVTVTYLSGADYHEVTETIPLP